LLWLLWLSWLLWLLALLRVNPAPSRNPVSFQVVQARQAEPGPVGRYRGSPELDAGAAQDTILAA